MTSELSIAPAHEDDLPEILSILDDAAAWLRQRGIEQWPASFGQDATWRIDRIRAYVRQGYTYLVKDRSGTPVATFTLTPGADPEYAHGWPDGPDTGGYLFRMAVRRSAAGQRIGARIVDWASREVGRWGRKWLRVDVHRRNPELQAYYQNLGFCKVAEIASPDPSTPGRIRGSGALMQRLVDLGEEGMADRYDPQGTAAALIEAANTIMQLCTDSPPPVEDPWNTALQQAARMLETEAIRIKQSRGMYHRSMGSDSAARARSVPGGSGGQGESRGVAGSTARNPTSGIDQGGSRS